FVAFAIYRPCSTGIYADEQRFIGPTDRHAATEWCRQERNSAARQIAVGRPDTQVLGLWIEHSGHLLEQRADLQIKLRFRGAEDSPRLPKLRKFGSALRVSRRYR